MDSPQDLDAHDFDAHDLARLADILRELAAESGTLHAGAPDGTLHLRAAIGIPAPVLEIVRAVPVGKGMAGLAAERKCAVNSCNIQSDATGDVRPGARATGLAGSVAVPVLADDGRVLGVVGVATRAERTFTADEERAIAALGRAFFA
jgi:L-methionine (R)-S-oxide reductase